MPVRASLRACSRTRPRRISVFDQTRLTIRIAVRRFCAKPIETGAAARQGRRPRIDHEALDKGVSQPSTAKAGVRRSEQAVRAQDSMAQRALPVPDVPRRTSRDGTRCTQGLLRLLGGCIVSELERALVIGRATYERWLGTDPLEIEAAATAMGIGPTTPAVAGARNPGQSCREVEAYAPARCAGSDEQRRRDTDEALGLDGPR